ncbi:hypothetical protein B0H16DRAFT_742995 [Mycena metata]|uniref:Uncharacterized protein n=1 Tax=Mycena metata TaxID=1033252 RepID=A0AAD7GQS0_9AGAR|nr:hypothetical protein B0H16DRAFT_742995 [Mycena metata]
MHDNPSWPQRDSLYPADLIQLWEDHSFISKIVSQLQNPGQHGGSTTSNFSCYTEMFTQDPDVVFVLRGLLFGSELDSILRLSGLTYRIFQPFLEFRRFLDLPFPHGGSPLDFLRDPLGAGELYRDFQDIAEEMVLFWISRAKEVLSGNSDYWLAGYWLGIEKCPTSTRLLRELESLNLSQLCNEHAADRESHCQAHEDLLRPEYLRPVLEWLWKFSEPPLQTIAFWERQIADIERCIDIHDFLPHAGPGSHR